MFSFKTISFAATVALASFASAGPVPLPGFAAVPNGAGSAAAVSSTAIAAASGAPSSAVAVASGASSVARAAASSAPATKVAAVTSSVPTPSARALVAADADVDANVAVGRDLLDLEADADADVEVGRRGDQSLLGLVDQAIVDLTETCQALLYLQPANATEKAVSDLLCDVKQILGDLLDDVKGLTGLDASGLLGDITDVNAVGSIVADLLKLVFTALGGVLNVLGSAPADVISHLLQDICVIIADLLKTIFALVDGVLGLVGGLLGVVVGLLGDILPIVLQLNVSVLIQVLAL
ncbi:hypothetical protein EV714DRAFT_232485 [Schizophyllum commune]